MCVCVCVCARLDEHAITEAGKHFGQVLTQIYTITIVLLLFQISKNTWIAKVSHYSSG